MTDNQNVNKTTMKDVQLQHFLFKRASSENVWNVSENLVFLFFKYIGERVSKQLLQLAATTTGYPIRPFSFHLQPENLI